MVRRPAPGPQGGAWAQRTAKAAPGPYGMLCTQPQGESEFLPRGEQEPNGVRSRNFSRVSVKIGGV
jgi:hypothetical protein